MRLLCMEAKKMLFYQKGWLCLLLFVFLWMGALMLLDAPVQPDVETGKEQLFYYLEQVGGRCTPETEAFISQEASQIALAESAQKTLRMRYAEGTLSKAEFDMQRQPHAAVLKHADGFALLFEQYTYAREQAENRYLLYTNGWAGLLGNDTLDFLFVLLLLLLFTPVFCAERIGRMDLLFKTMPKGGRDTVLAKIRLSLLTAGLLSLLLSGLQYGFFAFQYGLPHGDYPLQSLSMFATSHWTSSLGNAFWILTLLRLVGAVCFTGIILFVSACVKGYALVFFTCMTTVALPAFLFPLASSKYFLPSPLGFLVGTGFLKGTTLQRNLITDEMTVVFQEIPKSYLFVLLALLSTVCLGMLLFVVKQHTNRWQKRHPRCGKLSMCLVLCLSLAFLSGCTVEHVQPVNYVLSGKQAYETADARLYCQIGTDGKQKILWKNKHSGEIRDLPVNPLNASSDFAGCLFGQGRDLYYLRYQVSNSGGRENDSRFCVVQLDMVDFSEKIVFERHLNPSGISFGVNAEKMAAKSRFWTGITAFFLNRDTIYFVRGDSELVAVSRWTGKTTTIASLPIGAELSFDGRYIHYQDADGEAIQYDTKENMLV